MSAGEMADMFDVSVTDYERVIAMLETHHDWNDERIEEEIDWID